MRRGVRFLAGTVLLFAALALGGCKAQGVPEPSPNAASSTRLVEAPDRYDGTTITFQGEAIGEAMVRGDKAWLHLNDDPYYLKNVEEGAELGGYNTGMPVWLPASLAEEVAYFGDYKHEGDVVAVEGTFHAACPEHGGDMDIHATSLHVVTRGRDVVDRVHPEKVVWAVGLSAVAALLWAVDRFWSRLMELLGRE